MRGDRKNFLEQPSPIWCIGTIEKYFVLRIARTLLRVTTRTCLQAVRIFGNCAHAIEEALNGASLL
jgi:hypothetical protein